VSKATSDYKKLRTKWYAKLKKSGFKDIEADDDHLKVWSSKFSEQKSVTTWEAKEAYYYMANHFLNTYKFKSNLDRIIWEYHSNAISVRSIAKLLNKTKAIKTNRQTVWLTVKKLRDIMKLNIY
jgi:hypothetical protein